MAFNTIRRKDLLQIHDGVRAIYGAASLEAAARVLVATATALVGCDYAGYNELDVYFKRSLHFFDHPDVDAWVEHRADLWHELLPQHPLLQFRNRHPEVAVARLSDVVDLRKFYATDLYRQLFREVETRHQLVLNLGATPCIDPASSALPVALGVPLNRSGSDFTQRDVELLETLQSLAQPALRIQRANHQLRMLEGTQYTPEIERSLMGFGLTERQAEVAFWMLHGKSNVEIGIILDVASQTVRQHSIAIFARLGVPGRLAMQRRILRAVIAQPRADGLACQQAGE